MKRRAFILTEILTSMTLQAIFALTLCAAFYMLLSFSTTTQQVIAAHDDGEVVISYIDSRIRNAGLGLWRCHDHRTGQDVTGVNTAFEASSNFAVIDKEYIGHDDGFTGFATKRATDVLPVSIVSNSDKEGGLKISCDATGKVFEGNVLNLLYAHEDTAYQDDDNAKDKEGKLVLQGLNPESPDEAADVGVSVEKFIFIDYSDAFNENIKTNFAHTNPGTYKETDNSTTDIKSWAVTEAGGRPVHIKQINFQSVPSQSDSWRVRLNAPYMNAKVYPVSELLNVECERIYACKSGDNNSLMIKTLGYNDSSKVAKWDTHPHTKNILELHMILDATKPVPIFTLEVLVSEGKNSAGNTQRPADWPAAYWKDEFANYNVHISRAEWRCYNLAPLFPHN